MVSAAPSGGRTFADTVGGGTLTGQTSGRTSDAPTRSEAEVVSAGPDVDSGRADADAGAEPAQSDFGTPAVSEAAPEAEAGPSLSDAAPAGWIGGSQDAAPASAGQTAAPAQASQQSAFGPQSVNADYQGSPYSSNYDQGAPSQAYSEGLQALSDTTQSALSGYDYQGSPYADMGPQQAGGQPTDSFDSRFGDWGQQDAAPSQAYQEGMQALSGLTQTALDPAAQAYQGIDPGAEQYAIEAGRDPAAEPGWFQSLISDIPGVTTPAWAQDFGKSIYDVGTWLSPLNQTPITFPSLDPTTWVDAQSPMGMPGHQAYAGPLAGPDVVGDRSAPPDTFDSRFGFDPTADTTNWGAVFEAPAQDPDYAAVFEGAAPPPDEGGRVEAFIPAAGRETNFDYGLASRRANLRHDDGERPAWTDRRRLTTLPPAAAIPHCRVTRPIPAPGRAPKASRRKASRARRAPFRVRHHRRAARPLFRKPRLAPLPMRRPMPP